MSLIIQRTPVFGGITFRTKCDHRYIPNHYQRAGRPQRWGQCSARIHGNELEFQGGAALT